MRTSDPFLRQRTGGAPGAPACCRLFFACGAGTRLWRLPAPDIPPARARRPRYPAGIFWVIGIMYKFQPLLLSYLTYFINYLNRENDSPKIFAIAKVCAVWYNVLRGILPENQ